MAKEIISFQLPDDIAKSELEARAAGLGLSNSALIAEGLRIMTKLDIATMKVIREYAEKLHITQWQVIELILIGRFAKNSADEENFYNDPQPGQTEPEIMPELIYTSRGLFTGEPLFDHLRKKIRYQ